MIKNKMDVDRERTCHTLKVIASLQPGQKLFSQGKLYAESKDARLQSVRRLVLGEGRMTNIEFIKRAIVQAFEIIEGDIQNRMNLMKAHRERRDRDQKEATNVKLLANRQQIDRIMKNVENSKTGITNFLMTYSTDSNIKAHGEILLENIDDKLSQFELALQNLECTP